MKSKSVMIIFGVLVVLALVGGAWQTSVFAQTVPPVVPADNGTGGGGPVIPPAGGATANQTVENGKAALVTSGGWQVSAGKNVLPAGDVLGVTIPGNLPGAGSVSAITGGMYTTLTNNGANVELSGNQKVVVSFKLSQDQLDAFKKDPNAGILWYDPVKKSWVRLSATLNGDTLSVETSGLGYFVVGSLK